MNNLPVQTTNLPAVRPTAPALSPELSRLLDSDGSPDKAANEIATSIALREEARSALPALKAIAEHRAGEEGVYTVVSRRFGTLGKPALSEAEYENWWADYYDACADLPLASLEAGMRAFVARPDAQFIPKPGELRHLAETAPSLTMRRYHRAARALQIADAPAERVIAPEQRAAVGKLMAEFTAQFKAHVQNINPVLRRPYSPTPVKTDEKGLTAEMRAHLARRAAETNRP